MHELGIVFHVIKQVEEIAAENKVSHVDDVCVQIGEVTGVVPEYLQDCWKWAVEKHEIMTGCTLTVEPIKAVTHCDGCGRDYPTLLTGKTCPFCGSGETWLAAGNEFMIKDITVT